MIQFFNCAKSWHKVTKIIMLCNLSNFGPFSGFCFLVVLLFVLIVFACCGLSFSVFMSYYNIFQILYKVTIKNICRYLKINILNDCYLNIYSYICMKKFC